MKRRIPLFLLFALLCVRAFAVEYEYGLRIVTYPSSPDSHTSLSLDEGKLIPARNSQMTLSFEMMNRRENVFGCIFRIITDKGHNIDLMYTADREDKRYPLLVYGSQVCDVPAEIESDKWIRVSITLNPRTGDIILEYDGTRISVNDADLIGAKGFRTSFGLCRFSGYSLDDVASVNIRNIEIMRGSRVIRHWSLSCHDGDCCTDDMNSSPAAAVNPVWILDQYITWNRVMTLEYDDEPSVAFGENGDIFITTDGTWLERHNLDNLSSQVIGNIGGTAPVNAPDQILFTGKDIFAYNVDDAYFARFNKSGRRWEGTGEFTPESHYWNKTSAWWAEENALVSFGGYGFYHYNNELMIQYPFRNKENVRIALDGIHPRYSAASAILGDTLYIFGGRGNPSGKQELSPRKYYDLYAVNLKTRQVRKLWEFDENPEYEFVPSGNMIYDRDKDCFYVFTSLEGGTLISINRDKQGFELMSLPINVFENAQYNFLNLWMEEGGDKLFGLVEQAQVDGRSTINILKINYPPINVDSLRQNMVSIRKRPDPGHGGNLILWISVLILLAASGALLFYVRFGKQHRVNPPQAPEKGLQHKEDAFYNFGKSSICFFGGFRVTDSKGNNITSQFTPTLKSLLVLLILSTSRDSNGIISNKLNRILWPYKPEDTANNNRNVYISKLRPILENIGDVTVSCHNRFWSIEFGGDVKCDYLEAQRLLAQEQDEEGIAHLLELLLSGMMLPNMEQEWANDFKSEFSAVTIDFLSKQLDREDLSQETLLRICDTIFQHDFLNEEALRLKCRILYAQGKVGLAKSAYDSFCREYSNLLGMDYASSLKQIVS